MDNSWVNVGARCVCVDARPGMMNAGTSPLRAGENYTISEVSDGLPIGVQIAEMKFGDGEYLFAWRFRPLTTSESDAELFADIARHAKIDMLADTINELAL